MALTRDFRETIQARAQRDPRFREALFTEAINAYLSGDTTAGKAEQEPASHAGASRESEHRELF